MSHFSVAVFTTDNSASVDDLLEPYYEGNTYPPRLIYTREQAITRAMKDPRCFAMTDDECFRYISEGYIIDKKWNVYDNSNPCAKWDWWSLDDCFDLLKLKETGEYVNSAKIKDVDFTGFTTFAVVTSNGLWFERGHMGWFAAVFDEDKNWERYYYQNFIDGEDPETVVTIVNCHI